MKNLDIFSGIFQDMQAENKTTKPIILRPFILCCKYFTWFQKEHCLIFRVQIEFRALTVRKIIFGYVNCMKLIWKSLKENKYGTPRCHSQIHFLAHNSQLERRIGTKYKFIQAQKDWFFQVKTSSLFTSPEVISNFIILSRTFCLQLYSSVLCTHSVTDIHLHTFMVKKKILHKNFVQNQYFIPFIKSSC